MKLRDHPALTYSGSRTWPPSWTAKDHQTASGEIGVLKYLYGRPGSNILYLVIEHDGKQFVGPLSFDDPAFGQKLATALNAYIGVSMNKIGDLEL